MKPNSAWRVLTVASVGSICGCVPGYNSMLFYTKTNAGLVVDTQPPEVALDIGRQEGLLSPSYEAGKTPPVMASFRFDSAGFFSNYLGSAFATGDAAVAMARLYSAPDWPDSEGEKAWKLTGDQWKAKERDFDSAIPLHETPKMPWFVPKEEPGKVRPVLFGTDTSLGFKVAWKNAESPVPDYLRLAYQRRELAFAAVTVGQARDENGEFLDRLEAAVPSLLATVDTSVQFREPWRSRFEYLQYFASGRAATALAFRRDVRGAMLKRLDPEQGTLMEEREAQATYEEEAQVRRDRIEDWLRHPGVLVSDDLSGREKELAVRFETERPGEALTRGALNRELLADWLESSGRAVGGGAVTLWLRGASASELDEAIDQFEIE